jgi:hypothetical protein
MRRPPTSVALVARTHGLVGGVALVSVAILHQFTRGLPYFEFGLRTYVIAIGISALYCVTGALVWCGAPTGRLLSRVCGLLYLARPRLGSYLWEIMDSAEYQAYFTGEPPRPPPL